MFIITPLGRKKKIKNITPMLEMLLEFNGRVRRVIEDANVLEDANAVKVVLEEFNFYGDNSFIVGNLTNEQVKEIIRDDNGYDFSKLAYQRVDKLEDLKIDKDALPYNSEQYMFLNADCFFSHYMTPPIEDWSDEDAEE